MDVISRLIRRAGASRYIAPWKGRLKPWVGPVINMISPQHRAFSRALPEPLPPLPPVVVAGYIASPIGFGQSARNALQALAAAGVPAAYTAFKTGNPIPESELPPPRPLQAGRRVNLIYSTPLSAYHNYGELGSRFFRGNLNVGVWAWELPQLEARRYPAFGPFQEIWTVSQFVQQAVAPLSPVPVVCIPHPVELDPSTLSRKELGLPDERFIFYFPFDSISVVERKNPLGLIEAYRRAFGTREKETCLVIKINNRRHGMQTGGDLGLDATTFGKIILGLEEVGGILLDKTLTRAETNGLLANCDCLVSLHRAEGFGLSIAEAMYYGKPVIATAYSGNLDFMTTANSYGVGYRLQETERKYGLFQAGSLWADPDIDQAAACMREVFENREAAAAKGKQAAADIRQHYSARAIGEKMVQRLQIAAFHHWG